MVDETPLEKLGRCEAVLQQIVSKIEEQTALEEQQQRIFASQAGEFWRAVEFGRADTYRKIVRIISAFQKP